MDPERSQYLETLLLYHEEEIMGEAYFSRLTDHFQQAHEREKLVLLAKVERFAAEAVRPLLLKYDLAPRADAILKEIGETWAERHRVWAWRDFVVDMAERYPAYLDHFEALEQAAPQADRPLLRFMTDHEVAAIAFANHEILGASDSTAPLRHYIARGTLETAWGAS